MIENNFISKELFKKRMKTCFNCPSYNKKLKQCKKCGCFLFIKAFLKTQECPLKKWDEEK
jgi:hypothetical protein